MKHTDIAIVGGGLAGSTAAAMLGRAGIAAIMIDPHTIYPPDFRCEKLDGAQVARLRKTGLAGPVLRAATHDRGVWIARFGRLLDKRPGDQHGILYDTLVNTIRNEIPPAVETVNAKVVSLATGPGTQTLALDNGEEISARLIVLASGLSIGLRHLVGISREVTSACHSITVGFNLRPAGRARFDFPALTYHTEGKAAQMAYLTLFPIGDTMRANLMVYRTMDDPWLRRMRQTPEAALDELMPHLRRLTGDFTVEGPVKIRPADLYVSHGYRQAGIVLVGDAFSTSCPAAGKGTSKVFTDVERLCNVYIPQWLATPGMDADKIAQFYDDPDKRACDAMSTREAYNLRAISIDTGLIWHLRGWAKFVARLAVGTLRSLHGAMTARAVARP